MIYNFGVPKAVATVRYLYNRYIGKLTTYIVASIEETDKSSFDFATLEEALTFAENCSTIGGGTINLHLQDGTHYFERDSYQPNIAGNSVAAYNFNHTHIFFSSDSKGSATVTFSPNVKINGGYVFRTANSKLGFTNVKVDYALGGAEQTKNAHFVRMNNAYVYMTSANVKGLNKSDFAVALFMGGNSYFYSTNTELNSFKYGITLVGGVSSGGVYNFTFKNMVHPIFAGASVFGSIKLRGTITEENVDNPIKKHQIHSMYKDNFYIDTDEPIAPKDNRRTLADSSERPAMDGVPDGTPYLQLDIGKPIWYKGKNDDGDDIWIDSDGNEV